MFRSVATPLPNPLPKGEGIKTLLADGSSTQRRVRTASGSDRIIFHFSFSIYHWPFGGFICHRTMSNNEQMKNAIWKMTNDPVATARGSDTPSAASAVKLFSFPVGNSRGHLNFVSRINPGFGTAGDIEQISKTGLLHNAGGGTRAKAAGTDYRNRRHR